MDETESGPLANEHQFAVGETFDSSERLLQAFSRSSAIGFAVLDYQLRYQAINHCLASINGMSAEAHLGFTTGEIFGELAEKIAEPCYHRVLAHGEIAHFEVENAVLPTRAGSRFSAVNTNFPIRNRAGSVQQIGIMVVEVTQQRRLEEFIRNLADQLLSSKTKETFGVARELQDSITQYHTALALSLEVLIRDHEKSTELMAESIKRLDQRIMSISDLVSSVAGRFTIDK